MGCLRCLKRKVKRILKCIPQFTPRSDDLIIFEFGFRKTYLLWRCSCFLLVGSLIFAMPSRSRFPSNLMDLKYMHGWLICLLQLGLGFESVALVYIWFLYPSWKLQESKLPFTLRVVWNQYVVIYSNIFSCAIVYGLFFSKFSYDVEQKNVLQHVITFYSAVHVLTTATPSHLCHVTKPLVFTLLFLVFSFFWQLDLNHLLPSGTRFPPSLFKSNSSATPEPALTFYSFHQALVTALATPRKALYRSMDWDNWPIASAVALSWIVCTACCHVFMVFVGSGRRWIFYDLRRPVTHST
ncbi:hypothetical protein RRG08_023750 [Elysia crispata]|uniref:Uncharacterized protein n=1 Tax=Elysia crispata TaxID=231223 RepID=A0AAE0ZXG3_9GAST|nr:hypothetical protein RRG08_023750 [Elysia crispata]